MTDKFFFGARSKRNLEGIHPTLIYVVERALLLSSIDFAVFEGLRSMERQRELYSQGRTRAGNIVTWTMSSKHLKQSDGYGHAVDLLPLNLETGKFDWNYAAGFAEIGRAMLRAADEIKTSIRWGADWNQNGKTHEKGESDSPHFELIN